MTEKIELVYPHISIDLRDNGIEIKRFKDQKTAIDITSAARGSLEAALAHARKLLPLVEDDLLNEANESLANFEINTAGRIDFPGLIVQLEQNFLQMEIPGIEHTTKGDQIYLELRSNFENDLYLSLQRAIILELVAKTMNAMSKFEYTNNVVIYPGALPNHMLMWLNGDILDLGYDVQIIN